jgi:uncharacterized membrane protein
MARIRITFRPWPRIFVPFPSERAAARKLTFSFTLAAVIWAPISGAAFIPYSTKDLPEGYSGADVAYYLWGVHAVIIFVAAICWLFEKPRMKDSGQTV